MREKVFALSKSISKTKCFVYFWNKHAAVIISQTYINKEIKYIQYKYLVMSIVNCCISIIFWIEHFVSVFCMLLGSYTIDYGLSAMNVPFRFFKGNLDTFVCIHN